MPSGTAARRYAQAVFEMADGGGTLDRWERDLGLLAGAMGDEAVADYLRNPQVPASQKRATVDRILGEEGQQLTRNLAALLIERGRLALLPQIYNSFHERLLERRGIAVGEVTTAVPLDEEELALVSRQLRTIVGKDVEIRQRVDPSIIGGIIARVGDQLIDGSVTSRLRRLREQLVARR
ncbi:MAG: ATP synthase F1 subunit delta [Chloroflexota bacterium]|nr:ATP synthase F1 subunit delta [Chloroflexota bacterium]